MTDTKQIPEEETATVDEYTARMDRMLESLQSKSRNTRTHQSHLTWIWLSAGIVVSSGLIYLALSISHSGLQGSFHTLFN